MTAPRWTRHEVAELDVVLRDGAGRPGERRPAARLAEPLGRDRPAALERAEPPDVADPPQPHRLRAAAGAEAGDGGGDGGVLEGDGRRLEHVDGLAAQAVQQQLAHQAAVVGVEPLRGGDEGPPVARPGARRRGQEEVDVQPGEAAGLQAVGAGGQREPLLPARGDLVVAHVGGVAEEERAGAVRGRELRGAVVAGHHPRAPGEPRGGEVAAADRGGERVELDRHQPGRAEAAAGRHREAPRARAGVDDPPGRALAGRPRDHGLDDRRRRVGGAVGAPAARAGAGGRRPRRGDRRRPRSARAGRRPAAPAGGAGRDRGPGRSRRATTPGRRARPARGRPRGGPAPRRAAPRRSRWAARGRVYGGGGRLRGAPARIESGPGPGPDPSCAGDEHRATAPTSRTAAAPAGAAASAASRAVASAAASAGPGSWA